MKKIKLIKQLDSSDCGIACLRMIAGYYGKFYKSSHLKEYTHIIKDGVSIAQICDVAEEIGLRSLPVSVQWEKLKEQVPLPCVAYWEKKHFIVIYKIKNNKVYVADPGLGYLVYTEKEFLKGWLEGSYFEGNREGLLVLFEPTDSFYEKEIGVDEHGFKVLLPYLKPYRKYLFHVILGLFFGSVIQIILPFLTQSIVDKGVGHSDVNFIIIVLVAQLTLIISQNFLSAVRGWFLLVIGSRISISFTSDFLMHLIKLPISFFESKTIGDILQRVQDSDRIEKFLASSPNTLFSLFNAFLFLFILLYYDIYVFSIFFIGTCTYVLWISFFMKKRYMLDEQKFEEQAEVSNKIMQIVNGIGDIKINNSEKKRRWGWEESRLKLYNTNIKRMVLNQKQFLGSNLINELKNIFITFFSAMAVIEGTMTLGVMIAIQYIVGQINAPLLMFVNFIKDYQDSKLSIERLSEVNRKEIENFSRPIENFDDNQGILVNNLSFKYGGKNSEEVLKNVSFKIPYNKTTAIVGASGSGKTTLLKLLLGFYKPNEGEILVGKIDLNNINPSIWRKYCGVVMQNGYMFSDTLLNNIIESCENETFDRDRLLSSVKGACLEEVIEKLPNGYSTIVGTDGSGVVGLSGGQIQRVLIARALYKNAPYLFFDEATSSLDSRNEKMIVENLGEFSKGRTSVIIAHRLSTVKNSDNIIVLDKGGVVEQGTHSQLIEKKGYYFSLVKNQLELGG
ncbi:peptidase domain-containing ABC transporter [Tenacibaculum sp. TC6]|uniref:peptidase domain-containing ABC transporter n=1 Tax=Tenacibaculum sp. TC6 TaxID=3423223 RepID=UPI003D36F7E5